MRRWCFLLSFATLAVGAVGGANADDRPIVAVSREAVSPERLEVHVGEVVTWRAAGGGRLRIELDKHRDAHEVIERTGQIRGVFRQVGEHSYEGQLVENGQRRFRGVVVVRPPTTVPQWPETCGPESSTRICFAP